MNETGGERIGLIYVSVSNLRLPDEAGQIDAIVEWSRKHNRENHITGALVFTEKRFAQYLEGPDGAVDALMARIICDPRHRDVELVSRTLVPRRRFSTWAMAYAGPSTFVAGYVLAVAEAQNPAGRVKYADRLIEMMTQFVEAQMIEQRRNQGS